MPRRTRVEHEGARYHVINRGNYRARIFEDVKTKEAFEGCLGETVVRQNTLTRIGSSLAGAGTLYDIVFTGSNQIPDKPPGLDDLPPLGP